MALTEDDIQPQMTRRRPGQSAITTPRDEKDRVEIQSGTEFGITLGTPIGLRVMNENQRKQDYGNKTMDLFPRPSHADWTYLEKYGVKASSGGGRSSARETIGMIPMRGRLRKSTNKTTELTTPRPSRRRRHSRKIPLRSLRHRNRSLHELNRKRIPLPPIRNPPHGLDKPRIPQTPRHHRPQNSRPISPRPLPRQRLNRTHGKTRRRLPRQTRQHRRHSNMRDPQLPHRPRGTLLRQTRSKTRTRHAQHPCDQRI